MKDLPIRSTAILFSVITVAVLASINYAWV